MYQISTQIPQPFLRPLDEIVQQSGAGSRENWLKNLVRNIIIDYQVKKDLGPEYQKKMNYLLSLWP